MTDTKSLVERLRTKREIIGDNEGNLRVLDSPDPDCIDAADRLEALAPVEGMETTAEYREMLRVKWEREKRSAGLSLLRDIDRLAALLAAGKERAAAVIGKLPELARKIEKLEIAVKNHVKISIEWQARAEKAEAALREAESILVRYEDDYEARTLARDTIAQALGEIP